MTNLKNLNQYDIQLNYKRICECICKGNPKKCYEEFMKKTDKLLNLRGQDMEIAYRLALNNLNYSIYHYLVFTYDIVLTDCCYSNILLMHTRMDENNFSRIAENIIYIYYSEMLDMKLVTKNPIIQRVLQYIEDNIGSTIKIRELAKMLNINSTYLSQLFKQSMGQSFTSYITQHRIHHAKILLLQTGYTIDEISFKCGFGSPSYFSRVFANRTGMSPGVYRKNYLLNCLSKNTE